MMTTTSPSATMPCHVVACCISCNGVRLVGRFGASPTKEPSQLSAANVLANSAVSKGSSKAIPESDSDSPLSMTSQNRIFCPALNFQAGGCEPLTNMPPPLTSQTISRQVGKLCRSQTTNVSTNPAMKANAT